MANTSRVPGVYGRNAPHPMETHPRLRLETYLNVPATPSEIDWCSKVTNWPIYYNDQLGDCTCACVGHQIQGWTAYAGSELVVPDESVLGLYEAMGYVPGDSSTDNGAVIQDVLKYMVSTGIPGGANAGQQKYSLFAEISDLSNMATVSQALYLFGSVYLGINVPQSAEDQFQAGQPWSNTGDQNILGGHAIPLQKRDSDGNLTIITWGTTQVMEQSFWDAYVEEAWVVLTPQWLSSKGDSPDGLDLATMQSDFQSLYG